MVSFRERVLEVVARIPKGKTLSYQEVARLAKSPQAYRTVGNILSKNYNPRIPCHRVIRASGLVGGYNRGRKKKIETLKREGVIIF